MVHTNATQPAGVAIVEDDAVTRSILAHLIDSDPRFWVAASFNRACPAIKWLNRHQPDILLTDIGLPDGSGIDVIRACVHRCPEAAIMVVSMSSDEDQVLQCIEAGATGYVLKDAGRVDVVSAMQDLMAGGSPISPRIARTILGKMRAGSPETKAMPVAGRRNSNLLTPRELTILELIARGDSYEQASTILCVSVGTVQTHVKNIYRKLCVHSRGEAVYEAHRRGLLRMTPPRSNS